MASTDSSSVGDTRTGAPQRLPRGRHSLSRQEVADAQRSRIMFAAVDIMADKGYTATSVADIIARAGTSRETFYQQFESKLDCFTAAFEVAAGVLVESLRRAIEMPGSAKQRLSCALTAYLDTLGRQPRYARLFLVEVFAAGPTVHEKRVAVQEAIVDVIMDAFALWVAPSPPASPGTEREPGIMRDPGDVRFVCEMIVSAVSSMATTALISGDVGALATMGGPVMRFVDLLIPRA